MAEVSKKYCSDVTAAQSSSDAVSKAFDKLSNDDILLCWGSLYIAGEIRGEIKKFLEK